MPDVDFTSPWSGKKYKFQWENEGAEITPEDYDFFSRQIEQIEKGTKQSALGAFGSGVGQGLATMPGTVLQGVGAMVGSTGLEEAGKYSAQQAREAFPIDPMRREDFTTQAGQAVGQALAQLGLAVGTGGGSVGTGLVLGTAAAMGAASGSDRAAESGLTGARRMGRVYGSALVELGSERLFGLGSKSFLSPTKIPTTFGQKAIRAAGTAGGEGAEEVVAGVGNNILDNLTALGLDIPTPDIVGMKAFKSYGEQGLLGMVGGTVFAGAQLALGGQATENPITEEDAAQAPTPGAQDILTRIAQENQAADQQNAADVLTRAAAAGNPTPSVTPDPNAPAASVDPLDPNAAPDPNVPPVAPAPEVTPPTGATPPEVTPAPQPEAAAGVTTAPEVAPVTTQPPDLTAASPTNLVDVANAGIVEPTQTPPPDATQVGQVPESNLGQYPNGNEVGTAPEAGDSNRPVEGGQVEQAPVVQGQEVAPAAAVAPGKEILGGIFGPREKGVRATAAQGIVEGLGEKLGGAPASKKAAKAAPALAPIDATLPEVLGAMQGIQNQITGEPAPAPAPETIGTGANAPDETIFLQQGEVPTQADSLPGTSMPGGSGEAAATPTPAPTAAAPTSEAAPEIAPEAAAPSPEAATAAEAETPVESPADIRVEETPEKPEPDVAEAEDTSLLGKIKIIASQFMGKDNPLSPKEVQSYRKLLEELVRPYYFDGSAAHDDGTNDDKFYAFVDILQNGGAVNKLRELGIEINADLGANDALPGAILVELYKYANSQKNSDSMLQKLETVGSTFYYNVGGQGRSSARGLGIIQFGLKELARANQTSIANKAIRESAAKITGIPEEDVKGFDKAAATAVVDGADLAAGLEEVSVPNGESVAAIVTPLLNSVPQQKKPETRPTPGEQTPADVASAAQAAQERLEQEAKGQDPKTNEQIRESLYTKVDGAVTNPTINATKARELIAKKLGFTPKNVSYENTDIPNENGNQYSGKVNLATKQITINLRNIKDSAHLEDVLMEEMDHLVYADPMVQAEISLLSENLPDDIKAEVASLPYKPEVQREEATIRFMRRLANEPNTSSLWKRFVDSVRAAFRRLFNGRLTERDLKMAADRVAARSFRAMAAQSNRTGTRFSYIGEQSIKNLSGERRKFMADSLDAAKAMAAAGKSREEIRAVTGWFPGKYDGKMRWEIPDGGAYLKRNWEDSGVFSNLIEHPALLEAYPDLKYVGVSHRELPDGIYAQYSPDYDLITLNSNVTNRKEVLSYVLHELQHAVQKRESFARGSSMDEAYLRIDKPSVTRKEVFETYQKAAGEIEARDVQARQNLTPEQRKATAPYSSENIAEEDAIVMFESGGPQASMSMPSPEAQRVDQEYMAAVEAGDMETAQRLVDEAAQKAGYDIKGYHGTRSPVGFTEFIPNEALGRAIFVAVDPSEAQAFGRIMPVFIKTQNVRKGVVRSYAEVSAIAAAKKRGQDAIRVTDGIGAPINYAVFDPNQIKSANAVERDDAENIIPPSQRFNAASSDIRYSLPDPNEPAPAVPDVGPNALTRETVAAESVLDRLNKFILGYERESNEPKTAAKKAAAKKVAKKAAAPKPKPKKEEVDPNVSAVNQFIAEFKKNSGVEKADAEPKAKNPAKETLQRYTKLPTKKEGPGYPLDEDGETAFMSDLTQELVDLGVPVALAAEASAYAWARYSTKKQNQIDKKALAEFEKAQAEKERQAEKQEAQKNRPTQIAQAFIDRVDESQTEFVVEPGAKTLDLVSQALRDASKAPRIGPVFDTSPEAKRTFINALSSKLSSLGVDRVTAETAANRAWLKYQASRSAKEIDARDKETLAAAKKEIRARELQNKKEEREIQAAIDKPNNSAQSFIDAVDESQTETMPAERTVDPVRKALQEASSVPKIGAAFDLSPEAKSVFIAGLKSKLMSLGVDETLARTASERAWSKYQASRTAKQKTVRENEATAKAEALQKAREKPNNTAKAYIKNATTSITTTEEKVKNPVTQALNEAAKISRQGPAFDSSPQAKNAFMTGLSSKLMSLGVDSQTAWSASNVAWDKYQTALEAKAASLLKEFEKNIPATLARKIKELPVFRQNDAEYVRQYIKDLFIFAGLTSEVAEAATTLYSAKYAQMLKDARVKAATKYIENEASPKTKDVLKKRPNELDKILEAIRLGVTDPSMTVALALSDQSKFQRFTQEEHNRMVALEEEINDEDTPNLIKLERTQELVKLAESKMNDFNAIKAFTGYLVGNTLSGIGTAAIQIWTPAYSMGNRLATDGMRGLITGDPKRFIASLTALMNSADSVNAEFKYAFGNDVYRRGQQAELQTLSELRKVLDKNIPIFQNPKSGVEKAVAAAKIALAAPDYVRRLYSSMDTASQSLFINQIRQVGLYDLLRKNGMDMKKFEIMLEAKRLYRDSIITTLTLEGKYTPTQIRLIAEDSAIEDFGVRVAEAIGADGAQQVADLFRTSVNEGKSEIGVSDQVDGHAIPAILKILEGIKSAVDSVAGEKGQGAGDLAFRLIVGYPTTALKVLNRSLYFFPPTAALRYLTNRYYEKQPDFDPKADRVYPLLETHSQKLQRISEGIMGMFASAILLALLIDEKDKEEKDRRFAVHNLGPSDRAAKQAWRAAGNVPQSIQWRASENAPWISVSWAKAGLEALAPVLAVAGTYYDVSDESSEDTESSEKIIKAVGGVMGVFNRPLSGINDIGEILSGEKNSVSQKSLASYTAFRASGLVPFSSLLKTVNRMEGPRDMSTPTSTMLSQIPIAGPMLTEPAINMFGDPLGATPNELSYKLPIFPVQVGIRRQDVPFYEKILSKGQYPPLKLRTNFEKTYGPVSDLVWRQYVEKRGQMVKKLIIDRWTDLDKLSPEAYDKVLGKFANAADDVAIQELNIRRLPK